MSRFFTLALILFCHTAQAKLYICTTVYCDPKGQESMFPNSNSVHKSSSTQFQKKYWECATVMLATSVRYNPDAVHILFTNKENAPQEFQTVLDRMQVHLITLPFVHNPPDGWFHMYKNSVYTLDVINYLAAHTNPDDIILILDADVVWVHSAKAVAHEIEKHGCLHYDLTYPPEHMINGLSMSQARDIYQELLQTNLSDLPQHTGGEFVGATGKCLKKIAAEIDDLWPKNLQRFYQHKTTFNTEEHCLSFIYHKLGYTHPANAFIRRIGTDKKGLRSVDGSEFSLTLWHMPAEKGRGFAALFKLLADQKSLFWKLNLKTELPSLCAQACSIT